MNRSVSARPSLPVRTSSRLVPARLRRVWREALALLLALPDPRTPISARVVAVLALLYAVSPVDLLPDSIPVLGVGDDLLIVPALLAFAARLLPAEVHARAQGRAAHMARHGRWLVPLLIVVMILAALVLSAVLLRGLHALLG